MFTTPNYQAMTTRQLRKLIREDKSLTVPGYTTMSRRKLIEALEWADDATIRAWTD